MDIVAILVEQYECSRHCCDSKGQTPLHYAAYGGSFLVVKYLITEQHCDPMHINCDGYTINQDMRFPVT